MISLFGSAQRVPKPDPLPGNSFDTRPDPTRFSFRNHRVAGNRKHRVLPDILGKPEEIPEIPGRKPEYPEIPENK